MYYVIDYARDLRWTEFVAGKPKLVSNHAWQKHIRLTAKLKKEKRLCPTAKNWKRLD